MKTVWRTAYDKGVRVKVCTLPGSRHHLKVARVTDQRHYVKVSFRNGEDQFFLLSELEIL